MRIQQPITTFKVFDGPFSSGQSFITDPIDLRQISRHGFFSTQIIASGSGTLIVRDYRGPEPDRISTNGSTLYYQYGLVFQERATMYRKCLSGIATVATNSLSTYATVGAIMRVWNMGDSSYNGFHKVTAVIDPYTFSFELDHPDELQTTDLMGSITRSSLWYGNFPSVAKPMPWAKFGLNYPGGGYGYPNIKVWINVH